MQWIAPSLVEVVITHPFDVWKIRSQMNKPFSFLRHSYRGISVRAAGFIPTRTVFWWAQHNAPFSSKQRIQKLLFITSCQSMIDIPCEYIKTRFISKKARQPIHIRNLSQSFGFHFMRNALFTTSLLTTKELYPKQKKNSMFHTILRMSLGACVGSIISQPFDVLKTRFASNIVDYSLSMKGIRQRLCITTLGLSIGQFVFLLYELLSKHT